MHPYEGGMPSLILIPPGAGCVEESRRPPSFPKNRTTDHATDPTTDPTTDHATDPTTDPTTDHATDIKGEMTNMKMSCLKEDLAHGLSVVNHAVPNRTPPGHHPERTAEREGIQAKALRHQPGDIHNHLPPAAVIQEEGETTVPARLLAELVNSLPNERIDLELPEESGLLHLTCAQVTGPHQQRPDAKEFPPIPGHRREP